MKLARMFLFLLILFLLQSMSLFGGASSSESKCTHNISAKEWQCEGSLNGFKSSPDSSAFAEFYSFNNQIHFAALYKGMLNNNVYYCILKEDQKQLFFSAGGFSLPTDLYFMVTFPDRGKECTRLIFRRTSKTLK